ncbi:MAG: tyrosine-type recombinase/integrase [Acidobacteriota bacterium]|nr:tyrosine-type recombinase/integrase [Acidobacteriota bacterium]
MRKKGDAMKPEKNLIFVPGIQGKPSHYLSDITLNYRRVRRYAGRTKEEARAFLAKLRIAARGGKLGELIDPKPTGDAFGAYARALLDSAEWKEKRSAPRNEISLKHLNRAFKNFALGDITPGAVRKYITSRREAGLSPASINREISLLKSVLYAAEYDGLIASNPIRGRRVKKLEENNSREKLILKLNLSDQDLIRLLDAAAPHLRPILMLAITTGMRKSEILKMRWEDMNLRLGTIRVPAENSKTKRERVIPIDGRLIAELDSLERKSDYVFMNFETGKNITEIKRSFSTALRAAGIAGLRFHDLRHLAAYRLVKVTDLVTTSKILGHASVQMTMRYVHPTDTDKRTAIERVTENLFQCRQNVASGEKTGFFDEPEKATQTH